MFRLYHINDCTPSEYAHYYALMSDEKKARVDRYRFEADKQRTVIGEMLARRMIAAACGIPEEAIRFDIADGGKPYTASAPVHFSISHSGNYVLCAVSDEPIGADIEKLRPVEDRLIAFVCTEEEAAHVAEAADEAQRERRFFRIWTAKEACFKYRGTGIGDFKSIDTMDASTAQHLQTDFHGEYAVSIYTHQPTKKE